MLTYLVTAHSIIYFLVLSVNIAFSLLIWIVELRVMKVYGVQYFKTSVKIAIYIVHWHLIKLAYLLEFLIDCRIVMLKIHVYDFRLALKG